MKRILCIFMLTAMLAGLTACNRNEPEPEPEPPEEFIFDPDTFVLYTTVTSVYESGSIKIEYPQIEDLLDTNMQTRLNEIIRTCALEILYSYDAENQENLSLDIEYEVTRTSGNLMSIVFRGTAFTEGAAHPNHIFYTVNVDVQVGVEVALLDMIVLGDEFVEIFRTRSAAKIPEADEYIKDNDNEFLIQAFRDADNVFDIYSETYSYYTDDSVIICFYVPHAIGGYAEFEIKYSVLAEAELIHEWRL
jgi:hypothetical protein